MDTLKILLGATVALLLAALGLSLKGLNGGGNQLEIARQTAEIEKLKNERLQLENEKLRLLGGQPAVTSTTPTSIPLPPPSTAPDPAEVADMKARIAELDKKNQELEKESSVKEQENRFLTGRTADQDAEKNKDTRRQATEARRVAMIQQASVMGKVLGWVENAESGNFAIIDVLSPENVQPGTELLIRRNSGILGKLRVDQMGPDGNIANPVTKFSNVKPVEGDELILEPPFVGPIEDE